MLKNTLLILTLLFCMVNGASAELNVVATNPDIASIAEEIGKEKVKISTLGKGYQDPHFVDPKPNFVLKLNKADVLLLVGMELEVGWLPVLISGARNAKISGHHSEGYVDCSEFIPNKLEVPHDDLDRSMGHVHADGNPHYMLDPRNGVLVAKGIYEKFSELDPANEIYYKKNYFKFKTKLSQKVSYWEDALQKYRGLNVITYHKNWAYFLKWAGFNYLGSLESKPGIVPSPSHIKDVVEKGNKVDSKLIITSNYYPSKTGKLVSKKINSILKS